MLARSRPADDRTRRAEYAMLIMFAGLSATQVLLLTLLVCGTL